MLPFERYYIPDTSGARYRDVTSTAGLFPFRQIGITIAEARIREVLRKKGVHPDSRTYRRLLTKTLTKERQCFGNK